MKNKPQLKKVKIDEHIKNSKSPTDSKTDKRRPGRPRKSDAISPIPGAPEPLRVKSPLNDNKKHVNPDSDPNKLSVPPVVQPIYDTTEEAKGFLRAPFDVAAGLTGISKLALYPHQLDAMAPSFKIVYDKRIAPKLGEEADLIAFGMVFLGVAFEKVQVFKEEREKLKPVAPQVKTDSVGSPFIPTEHHV